MADIEKIRVRMVRVPFNYHWPRAAKVSVVRDLGPALLDKAIAEAAIEDGAAVPFDPKASAAPATKAAPARRRAAKPASTKAEDSDKVEGDAADESQSDRMDQQSDADDDRPEGGDQAISDAG